MNATRPSCPNRASQWARTIPLEIFKTERHGWGVRAAHAVPAGKILGYFTGNILPRNKAQKLDLDRRDRWKRDMASAPSGTRVLDQRSYLFDLDMDEDPDSRGRVDRPSQYTIDSWNQGNWTRFLNHSCEPALRVCNVMVESPEPYLGRLAFVALRDIDAGTELTIDYNPRHPGERSSPMEGEETQPCLCGAELCRGWIKA
ncbi:hypothetical protein BOTBODRAFT_234826 [Botryobasidium botryosum FD-172 SS1]|uniref:SET domain-containing protein n=1 Tax=Botryobasidium botryosum (strain FD-172 SS1) TaxID=930990 RepID=A0A067M5G1_BOTB1|nr:hypothetical protein BOTBODRAFT_234826 [Botryobasidium botryosum FD-172 SS1]